MQSILVALLTLSVPILAWIHRGEEAAGAVPAALSTRLVLTLANDGTWRDEQGPTYEVRRHTPSS